VCKTIRDIKCLMLEYAPPNAPNRCMGSPIDAVIDTI